MNVKLIKLVTSIRNPESREPAFKVGAATGTVAGILALITLVFPNWLNETQQNAILLVGTFLLPIITALLTRGRVWSPASVKDLLDQAIHEVNKTIADLKREDQLAKIARDLPEPETKN